MTLLKPNKRDIVKAATELARQKLGRQSMDEWSKHSHWKSLAQSTRDAAAKKVADAQVSKLQPIADQLNAVTETAGFGRPYVVRTRPDGHVMNPGTKIIVYISFDAHDPLSVMTRAKYPKDTAKIKEFDAKAKEHQDKANHLRDVSNNIEDRDVLSGSINSALNGESAAALELIATNIGKIALDHANQDRHNRLRERR